MADVEVARVEVAFTKSEGAPTPSADEVARWVEHMLGSMRNEPEGYNGMRYSTARVTMVRVP